MIKWVLLTAKKNRLKQTNALMTAAHFTPAKLVSGATESTHNAQSQIWYKVEQEYRYFKKRHAAIVNGVELFN